MTAVPASTTGTAGPTMQDADRRIAELVHESQVAARQHRKRCYWCWIGDPCAMGSLLQEAAEEMAAAAEARNARQADLFAEATS